MLVGIAKIPESTWETLAGKHKMNKICNGGLVFFLDKWRNCRFCRQCSEDLTPSRLVQYLACTLYPYIHRP